jgi:hypothetical protein
MVSLPSARTHCPVSDLQMHRTQLSVQATAQRPRGARVRDPPQAVFGARWLHRALHAGSMSLEIDSQIMKGVDK